MYLDTDMKLEDRTAYSGLCEYMKAKLDYEQYIVPEVENYRVDVEVTDREVTDWGILFTLWVVAEFNYVDLEQPSSFGRTAQVFVDKSSKVADMWTNDGTDSILRAEGISLSDDMLWVNDELVDKGISCIENYMQEAVEFEHQEEMYAMELGSLESENSVVTYATSSITATQRNAIAKWALDNVYKTAPVSGNPNVVSVYNDLSSDRWGDCTNFVSHSLLAGGAAIKKSSTGIYSEIDEKINLYIENDTNYWYYTDINFRSTSWSDVESFYKFLKTNKGTGPKAQEQTPFLYNCTKPSFKAEIGDIIQIDYEKNGTYNHTIVITNIVYRDGVYVPYIAGRSGVNSGLAKWFDTNVSFSTVTKFKNGDSRLLHLTSLT